MTVAERIFRGMTAEELGITPAEFSSRKVTLGCYLQQSGGGFDEAGYLAWLSTDQAGDRGNSRPDSARQPIRIIGGPTTNAKRSCCGGGKIR